MVCVDPVEPAPVAWLAFEDDSLAAAAWDCLLSMGSGFLDDNPLVVRGGGGGVLCVSPVLVADDDAFWRDVFLLSSSRF